MRRAVCLRHQEHEVFMDFLQLFGKRFFIDIALCHLAQHLDEQVLVQCDSFSYILEGGKLH